MVGTVKKSTETIDFHVIVEERPPGLGRRLAMTNQVFADAGPTGIPHRRHAPHHL